MATELSVFCCNLHVQDSGSATRPAELTEIFLNRNFDLQRYAIDHQIIEAKLQVLDLPKTSSDELVLSARIRSRYARYNELLLAHGGALVHELPLAHMAFLIACCRPNLVIEFASLLTLNVLERALLIQTRVEFASFLDVGERAAWPSAVRSVATERAGRMFEGTGWICTIWEVFAVLLGLVGGLRRRRWVTGDALSIRARRAEWTGVFDVDGRTRWRCR